MALLTAGLGTDADLVTLLLVFPPAEGRETGPVRLLVAFTALAVAGVLTGAVTD